MKRLKILLRIGLLALPFGPVASTGHSACGIQLLVEFKSAETNRVKTGRFGFLNGKDAIGDHNIYRTYKHESVEEINSTFCSLLDEELSPIPCAWSQTFTHDQSWPTHYDPKDLIFSPRHPAFKCGWLTNDVDEMAGNMSYQYGSKSCAATLVDRQWQPPEECPSGPRCGKSISGDREELISDSLHYSLFVPTNNGCRTVEGSMETTQSLTDFYATGELVDHLVGDLATIMGSADLPWTHNGSATLSVTESGICARASAMTYRTKYFGLKDVEGDIVLKLHYMTIRQLSPTNQVTERWSQTISNHVVGTGRVEVSPEIEVMPIHGDQIRHSQITLEVISPGPGACGLVSGFGSSRADLGNGAFAAFGLGECGGTGAPGFLYIQGSTPDANLAKPESIGAFANEGIATLIGNNPIRQVAVPEGLVVIDDAGVANGYDIHFYDNYEAKENGIGDHAVMGLPAVSYEVRLVTTQPAYRLRITSSRGGTHEFLHTNGWWHLDRGDGQWSERLHISTHDNGTREETTSVRADGSGSTALEQSTTRVRLPGRNEWSVTRKVLGVGTDALTNLWFYKTDVPTNHINYGKLILSMEGAGGWERREYDPESGRLARRILPFENSPHDSPASACRVLEYDYTPYDPNDDGRSETGSPRIIREKIHDVLVGMRAASHLPESIVKSRISRINSDNLNTLEVFDDYWSMTTERFVPNGRVVLRQNDNFTATHEYWLTNRTGDVLTNITLHGEPSLWTTPPSPISTATQIIRGTKSILVSIPSIGRVLSRTSHDIGSGILLSREAYDYGDPTGSSHTITTLDGTTEIYRDSGCCGTEAVWDRDGVLTEFFNDALGRRVASRRLGITWSNRLDIAGNLLETWRTAEGGQAVRLVANTYDRAGRLTKTTDALGRVTTHTYGFTEDGRYRITTQFPDTSRRIQYINRDNTTERIEGSAVFPVRYRRAIDPVSGELYTEEIKLDSKGTDTLETVKTYRDFLNREHRTVYADGAEQRKVIWQLGLYKETDPDGVTRLFEHDSLGDLIAEGLDLDQSGDLTRGRDRRTQTVSTHATKDGRWDVLRTTTSSWDDDGNDVWVATQESAVNGLQHWFTDPGGTHHVEIVYDVDRSRTTTQTAPDGSYTVHQFQDGRVRAITRYTSNDVQIASWTHAYDLLGRLSTIRDLSSETATTLHYDAADQIITNIVSAPGVPVQITIYEHDTRGRIRRQTLPGGAVVTRSHDGRGLVIEQRGGAEVSMTNAYDAQGRLRRRTTWRDDAARLGAATTELMYDAYRGFMTNKVYGNRPGTEYSYTPGGRITTRVWARGTPRLRTAYTYGFDDANPSNQHADLTGVDYLNDPTGTPSLRFGFDLMGRRVSVSQGQAMTRLIWRTEDHLEAELHEGGVLDGRSVSMDYDSMMRRSQLSVQTGHERWSQAYDYDAASRLSRVAAGDLTATYTYHPGSGRMNRIDLRQRNDSRLTVTRHHDSLGRLTRVENAPIGPGEKTVSFGYDYDAAGRRERITRENGSYREHRYGDKGEVLGSITYRPDGTRLAGQQFWASYDDMGNRTACGLGGNRWGTELAYENYEVNSLNQYTSRTLPGTLQLMGEASTDATVTVNQVQTERQGNYFHAVLDVENAGRPVWFAVTNRAVVRGKPDLTDSIRGHVFVRGTPEVFEYDADGNMIRDGRWQYTWDAENRLVAMESHPNAPESSRLKLAFIYDWRGRRIEKRSLAWNGSAYEESGAHRYLYDGWNLVAEEEESGAWTRSYVWGADMSGTHEGASGVGGLLFVGERQGDTRNDYCAGYDGNGNVATLVSAREGMLAGEYDYGPFGEAQRVTGRAGMDNPIRYASKYEDRESGLRYFGGRFYDPNLGRWLNRDPIGEDGGLNVYGFVGNNPLNDFDSLGLKGWCGSCDFYGAAIVIGVQMLECYLETRCDPETCEKETVHLKAWFAQTSAGLPVNVTSFMTCFQMPDENDHTGFKGWSRFVSISVTAGTGVSGGKIVLGDAESDGLSRTSGLDWSAAFGSGRSWVSRYDKIRCP